MKTFENLERKIPNIEDYSSFLVENNYIVDSGRLAEHYCQLLFGIELSKKVNEFYDGIDGNKLKVEIKQRRFDGRTPPGMNIDLNKIDYVLYVFLNAKMLPEKILKFEKEHLTQTKGKRISFKKAYHNKLYEVMYSHDHS